MTVNGIDVVMISSAAGESGIGDYVDDLTKNLFESHVEEGILPQESNNPAVFAKIAIQAVITDPDVVHVQHEYGQFGRISLMTLVFFPVLYTMAAIKQTPVVITMHEGLNDQLVTAPLKRPKGWYVRLLNTIIAVGADQVIFLSEQTAEELEQSVTKTQCTILHHGVPTERYIRISKSEAKRQLGYDSDDIVIAEPGFIEPRKGSDQFVRLAERLSEYEFVLGGGASGPIYQEYVSRIKNRAPCNLTVTGKLDEERFHMLFVASDLVVLPYKDASQGGIVNTTNQSGILNRCATYATPALASNQQYFKTLEQEWEAVMTCDFEELRPAEETVRELIDSPKKRNDLAEAIAAYGQEHSFDRIAAQHEDIYLKLTAC